ncbi:MAG: hypothetical protein P9M14_08405, partial [Candidatus Alcyoniella australis]|nr:hypothetical protein [Candidatus Alcyoniella australis]
MKKSIVTVTFVLAMLAVAALVFGPTISQAQTTKRPGYCCCETTYQNDPNNPADDYVNYSYIEAVHCVDQTYVKATHACVEDAKCGVTQ